MIVKTIGIDLGTTNSLVAVWEEGKASIIPNALGEHLTPSVISIDEQGQVLVGQIAKERLITHPHVTVANFKRFMGTNKKFILEDYTFSAEDLSSFVLKTLKADAEAYLGEEVIEAVISVPAYFNDAQRKATKRAGELAGLKVERLISEPTAAALAYGMHQRNNNTQFLVFDLGGGTFDVSILELFEGVMEVKSVAGDNYLGGEDFNEALVSYFVWKHQMDRKSLDEKILSALFKQAELCKQELSNQSSSTMTLLIGSETKTLEIDRTLFEEICDDLLLKLKHPIERALRDADLSTKELDAVILIGGSTRMPLIKSVVGKMFNQLPFSNINPDETVALGAAIQAALKNRNEALKEMILTDVCPYTLGVEIVEEFTDGCYEKGYFLPIIERNSPIPISKVKRVSTVSPKQKRIFVEVYQGESRKIESNIKLGELRIDLPFGTREQQWVDIRYTYDINGLLEVEVTLVATGEKKSLIIENAPCTMTKEQIQKRLLELETIKIHPRDQMENRLIIARGERLYEEFLGQKRKLIQELLLKFEDVLMQQNPKEIEEAAIFLKAAFDRIEGEWK